MITLTLNLTSPVSQKLTTLSKKYNLDVSSLACGICYAALNKIPTTTSMRLENLVRMPDEDTPGRECLVADLLAPDGAKTTIYAWRDKGNAWQLPEDAPITPDELNNLLPNHG